jgi:type I restriction enzyme S subunit
MSWKKVRLGDLCTIEKGKTGIQKAVPGDYPLVVTAEDRKSHNDNQFDDEAVIIPLVSGTGHGHASIKRLHFQSGKFALGSILCAVIPKDKSILNAEYLFRFLNLNKERELVDRMKGMANVTLPIKEIAKIEIPLPSLDEQIEFVEKYALLETDSEEISSELNHQLDLIKQLRQAFLREAMQGKLVNSTNTKETGQQLLTKIKAEKAQLISDKKLKKEKELAPISEDEIPFEIPEHWAWCRLGEIGICKTGTTPSTIVKEYFGNDIPFIKPADITLKGLIINNEGLTFSGLKQGVLIPSNSLMMVCIGGSIGKSFFSEIEVSCNQQINTLTPLSEIKSIFLQFWLQSNYFQKEIWSKASGGTTPIVNRSKWESIFVPLPPLHEQEQIVAKLEELMAFCDGLEQSIKVSQGYNEMLLQQVLREALQGEKKK